MKKIITAINNPKLNEALRKEKKYEIVGKDIQYKEAIIETLEKDKNVDLIILSEEILGEIKIELLLEKIKFINEKIKIIFILEKENKKLEKILIQNKIMDIYYNNKININELIKIINKKEINMEEEIIKLKKIIELKNKDLKKNKYLKKELIDKLKSGIRKKIQKRKKDNLEKKSKKIIVWFGNYKSGKSTVAFIVSQCLSEANNRVLLIDGDLEKNDLSILLRKHKKRKGKKVKNKLTKKNLKKIKIKLNQKYKKMKNIKNIIYDYKIKNIVKYNTKKINKNLDFFNQLNKLVENKEIKKMRKMISIFFKIIQHHYDFVMIELSKNNNKEINREILKMSQINFILMEANLLGIKEIQQLLKKYFYDWRKEKNNLYIISNRKNKNSINKNLIGTCLFFKSKILEIKENKFYRDFFYYPFYRRKILLKNKIIKYEIYKIINKIERR